ncbi:MAG: hypothetical protein RIR70_469 [Pseudomonadota bacterium]|jgi:hypothetical protein
MSFADSVEILIPIHQLHFSPSAEFSVDQTCRVLTGYQTTFFGPAGLDVAYYATRYPHARFRFYAAEFFSSVNSYSRLLVSDFFYAEEHSPDFFLIVQPDVYLFRDDLPQWLDQPYDYVGAPWPQGIEINIQAGKFARVGGKPIKAYVGNGGFSLRRRRKCLNLIREHSDVANWFLQTGSNEDLFFALMGALSNDFILPNQMVASRFSTELMPEHFFTLNDETLPMGTHAFQKHAPDFWRQYIPTWPV